jgi:hypothetical protein
MSGSAMFRRLRELRPKLSVRNRVDPFDFEMHHDGNHTISLNGSELYINFQELSGELSFSHAIRKIGFYVETAFGQEKVYVTFETTDSYEGTLSFFEFDGRHIVALEVFKIGEEPARGFSSNLVIDPGILRVFSAKVQEQSRTVMPKRQAAQMAYNTRKHLLTTFVPPVKVERSAGAGAGAGAGTGASRRSRRTRRTRRH